MKSDIVATISVEEKEVYAEYLRAVRRQEMRQNITIVLLGSLVAIELIKIFY